MMNCQHCAAKSQLFLCNDCETTLHLTLADLPWWIDRLAEAAIGHTRLGDGDGGRRSARSRQLDGDQLLEPYITPNPGDENKPQAMEKRYATAQRQFMAANGVNAYATTLSQRIEDTLTTWIDHLCETRGLKFLPALSMPTGFIGPLLPGWKRLPDGYSGTPTQRACWLAHHAHQIANIESAGDCYNDITGLMPALERTLNRPVEPRFCGRCTTTVDRERCKGLMYARRDVIEVTCPICRTLYNVESLCTQALNEASYLRFTRDDIARMMRAFGEPVASSTLHDWIRTGKLKPQGYQRPVGPDGRVRIGASRHSDADKPVYQLAVVRRLRAAMPVRKAMT